MNFIGEFKCPKCDWVHVGISEAYAMETVDSFNAYFATLSQKDRQKFGGVNSSIDKYKRCFRCGSPSKDFVLTKQTDRPALVTLQAVIAPSSQQMCGPQQI